MSERFVVKSWNTGKKAKVNANHAVQPCCSGIPGSTPMVRSVLSCFLLNGLLVIPLGVERYLTYASLCSIYSYQATCDFLQKNALLSIIRAHEAQDAG